MMHCMSYYIFLKFLRGLEEFRKNPHIKVPPKSPCTNFQSLCKFKNPILFFERNFPWLSAQSAQQPASPFGLLAHPTSFSLLPHRSRARKPSPPTSLAQPPWPALTTSTEGKKSLRHPSLISPLNSALSPLQSSGNRRLQTRSIEAPSTPAIKGTRPLPPRLRPIKGRPTLGEDPHISNSPLSPHRAHAIALLS
jgi:hypothetical protein